MATCPLFPAFKLSSLLPTLIQFHPLNHFQLTPPLPTPNAARLGRAGFKEGGPAAPASHRGNKEHTGSKGEPGLLSPGFGDAQGMGQEGGSTVSYPS